ncbi:hypothetical protein JOB18_005758 [Solea senegalensis]|uniref:Uncharacterized protein n=1 Tax=Solea senegalensis TaxID=28829 RepID=A0AAV6QD68_SOLSE|nr:hypothetical protein JOB18_005758 [Solea senegalensis]
MEFQPLTGWTYELSLMELQQQGRCQDARVQDKEEEEGLLVRGDSQCCGGKTNSQTGRKPQGVKTS